VDRRFTYIATWAGFVYVAFAIDVFARCIGGFFFQGFFQCGLEFS
jgi:transposase InsO family protein